ncbi:hypothetical protein PSECIP111951_02009 [Pseudoalteromonas holothuriae]|uniref:Uncharacterized protein n=1 Tax=Pseudoalteromonas holothuriae TaxID=2963714 RepID=A0A9W4QV15_9GAMM|nr:MULTISPECIES: hypothetical protein [unclassified Pseudoalteromonas]CAH9054526.1 hypothetical protein PSECIP111854_01392 [Pseudoalteromonas sp. CIP111854]CAH9059117.1 hypothetical protein PSECIP111951_02009 [Pseudoalteromonas sp. CIP111951]
MGLTRKAWNNVVIFSMLLMIFFLNGIHHKLNPDDEVVGPQRLLPEHSFVLTLAFPGYKIERIGTSWRIDGPWQADAEQLKALVGLWQSTELDVASVSLSSDKAITVARFWLASTELPLSYQLYFDNQQYYLFDKQQQYWLELPTVMAKKLFAPVSLINP